MRKLKTAAISNMYRPRVTAVHLVVVFVLFVQSLYAQPLTERVWGDWKTWGDRQDGTYQNPILPADYSDLDCIRVGTDYYAISSTFQYSPGMVILQSKDLVNWKIAGHVVKDVTAISPEMNWNKMNRYGRGIWAGAIRYHDKKFWVYFGTPDEGYFMSTAKTVNGPWTPLQKVLDEKGWDDCCPFWDDDGQGYLVGSHFSDGYKIYLWKMRADGKELIKESGKLLYQGKGSEANKLYKINGKYFHFFSEVKTEGRAVMMARADNINGPYSKPKQLSHAQKEANEPNQGGLVQTQKGDWYFLTHHGTGDWSGRVMSLLPVSWIDGWPVIGKTGPDTIGTMVWEGKMPVLSQQKLSRLPQDDFDAAKLSAEWEWNYQPLAGKWSLKERKGMLRLHAFRPLEKGNLLKAGNTLTQRTLRTAFNEVIVKIDISQMVPGQHAGLSHFGSPHYAALGIAYNESGKNIEYNVKAAITKGPAVEGDTIWLKSTWGLQGESRFYYSFNGKDFTPFGTAYQMMWGAYRGDRIAIYNYNNDSDKGYIDVDFFRYEFGQSK